MFKDFFDWVLDRLGYISKKEYVIRSLPPAKQKRVRYLSNKLKELRSITNINEGLDISQEIVSIYREYSETKSFKRRTKGATSLINYSDLYGYKPAMSKIYGLFASNPFGAYAFVARHHPVVRSCLDVILNEISNDGVVLISEKGTTKKRLKEVWRKLKNNGIFRLRLNICKHLKLYGNCWMLPQTNGLGGKGDIMLLSPTRILPDIDPATDEIRGWLYRPGPGGSIFLAYDKVWHLRLESMDDYRPLGDPPLGPALIIIETSMNAISFNNQVFQKGGLMGIIIALKTHETIDPYDEDEDQDAVDEMTEKIETQFSGGKTGQSTFIGEGIENVYNVNPIGKLDGSHQMTMYEAAKTIAVCLGMPPEKIAVSRSSTLQYIPSLVEDSVNTQFDKMLNSLTQYVDDFINEKIIKERYGITDVILQAGGRYGSLTKNAADVIKTLADSGPVITINEALEKILGWEPLPPDNPRGHLVLDNTVNRDLEVVPMMVDPEKPNLDLGKFINSTQFLDMAYRIKSGVFEKKDKTYAPDDSFCHRVIINKWGVKFYEEIRKQD
jgi:hypothetical protein